MSERYLAFEFSGRRFGIEMSQCRELLELPVLAPVPQAPEWLKGVVHVRGSILPVFTLEHFVGGAAPSPSDSLQLLVLEEDEWAFGIPVREAFTFQAEREEWMPHPQSSTFAVLKGAILFEGEQLGLLSLDILKQMLEEQLSFDVTQEALETT